MSFNIGDVARLAQVSKATVSAVLNDRPGVSAQTRQRVMEVVKKINYRPNPVARSLSLRTTKSIGLVIKEIDNPYFAKVMKGVFDVCSQRGYTVLLGSSEESPETELQSVETLTEQRVDGLIISPLQASSNDLHYLASLIARRFPLVTLGEVKNYTTNVVDIDNVAASYEAVCYLIKRGHGKIAYFSGPAISAYSQDRLEGYRQAHLDHSLPLHKELVYNCGAYVENGLALGKQVFSGEDRPTAVFCFNDLVAIGVIDSVLALGLRVPDDVAVIGFDDIDFARFTRIPLTTVHVPVHEIGARAAELLIRQLDGNNTTYGEKILLNAHFVKRESA